MEDAVWRRAHLTPKQMEKRRLEAARLLRQGRLSQAKIARSRASLLLGGYPAQKGPWGLKARLIPGQFPRLDEKAQGRLVRHLDWEALAAGFATDSSAEGADARAPPRVRYSKAMYVQAYLDGSHQSS
jgi:hypothetical protein